MVSCCAGPSPPILHDGLSNTGRCRLRLAAPWQVAESELSGSRGNSVIYLHCQSSLNSTRMLSATRPARVSLRSPYSARCSMRSCPAAVRRARICARSVATPGRSFRIGARSLLPISQMAALVKAFTVNGDGDAVSTPASSKQSPGLSRTTSVSASPCLCSATRAPEATINNASETTPASIRISPALYVLLCIMAARVARSSNLSDWTHICQDVKRLTYEPSGEM